MTVFTHDLTVNFTDGRTISGEVVFNSNRKPCIAITQSIEFSISELQLFHMALDAMTALFKLSGGFENFHLTIKE